MVQRVDVMVQFDDPAHDIGTEEDGVDGQPAIQGCVTDEELGGHE